MKNISSKMPKDKYAGSDPDPTQFLFVSPEQKRADQVGPFLRLTPTRWIFYLFSSCHIPRM